METAAEILSALPMEAAAELAKRITAYSSKTKEERLEIYLWGKNSLIGDLPYMDCPKCLNKGVIYSMKNGELRGQDCECMIYRNNIDRLERSGLSDMVRECTFENYSTVEMWQKTVKKSALDYLERIKSGSRNWFYIGGASGSGKTHICTAIVYALIQAGMSVKYMPYKDETTILKGLVNDAEEYGAKMRLLKSVDVLYIDDLFKMKKPKYPKDYEDCRPTNADIKLIFEIINARYLDKSKITVISSEHETGDIIDFDESIASRIIQKCGNFKIDLSGKDKNWRLKA